MIAMIPDDYYYYGAPFRVLLWTRGMYLFQDPEAAILIYRARQRD